MAFSLDTHHLVQSYSASSSRLSHLSQCLPLLSAEASLSKLSALGHFLKGSSAALGIIKVQASCEKLQHYGNMRDEEVGETLSEDEALRRIKELLSDCKRDYQVAMACMKRLYEEDP